MASPHPRRLRKLLLSFCLLVCGLWLGGSALWQLGKTAIYVHESVVVTGTVIDVRQKPFESWAETLGTGNWSWPGDVSYQPIVRFTLPGGIDAIRLDLEADNADYDVGDAISIISPPTQPGKALINRWKFLWGASCLRLGIGTLLALMGYVLLKRLKGSAPARSAKPTQQAEAERRPARRSRGSRQAGERNTSSTPRRRKKAESSGDAPKKPRRSRRKKDGEQLELGL